MWFTKARRAQNENDFETWIGSGVCPTLNAFDNATETRATVVIIDGTRVGDVRVYEDRVMQTVIQRWGTGGGNVPAIAFHQKQDPINGEVSPALGTSSQGMGVMAVDFYNASLAETNQTLRSAASDQSKYGDIFDGQSHQVRRLTPTEYERLQGFPDGWTDGQADSHRYKQLGNAVAVPVVQWLINRTTGKD